MALIDYTIKYKVSNPYATSLRLVGKPNKPWAAYPTGYNIMSGAPNVPPSSAHTPPSFGFVYSWTYRTNKSAHDVFNIIAETTCKVAGVNVTQLGDIYYSYKPVPNDVTFTTGNDPVSGDPALIFTWDSLCVTCKNIKEYIITYVETGSSAAPFEVVIPFSTVYADPNFPTYTAYITSNYDPLLTYDVTFKTILTYEYDLDTTINPTSPAHMTVEQYINGNII